MTQNRFVPYLKSDNNICLPVVSKDQINEILAKVYLTVGEGIFPKVMLDLENLQIVDYKLFYPHDPVLAKRVESVYRGASFRQEELNYLALISLFCYIWPMPSNNEEIIRALDFEVVLSRVLVETSFQLAKDSQNEHIFLPYWARLSFLRVMSTIPEAQIELHRLGNIACTPIRSHAFNAHVYSWPECSVIGLDFALEPILKNFNKYILHFFHTQHMSGPARLQRAWAEISATVLYFSSMAPVTKLSGLKIIFEETVAQDVHILTADQIDFILTHEIGHICCGHIELKNESARQQSDQSLLLHQLEFEADAFAINFVRSRILNELRYQLHPKRSGIDNTGNNGVEKSVDALTTYVGALDSVHLLFLFMSFVEQANEILQNRLDGRIIFRPRKSSHPPAAVRWERMNKMCMADVPHSNPLTTYAEGFLESVLDYIKQLDEDVLFSTANPSQF